jgi:hypothetical protein
VALTGFRWLTVDRLVQQATYADGRVLIANFGEATWKGLGANCVRRTGAKQPSTVFCAPDALPEP